MQQNEDSLTILQYLLLNKICKDKDHIQKVVKRRVDEYGGEKQEWFDKHFLPVLRVMDIGAIGWEEILDVIDDPQYGEFYSNCLKWNRLRSLL